MMQYKVLALGSLLAVSHVPKTSSFGTPPSANRRHFAPGRTFGVPTLKSAATATLGSTSPTSSTHPSKMLTMLVETSGGMEELQEMIDGDPQVVQQVRKSPSLWKMAGYASIPLSAALGFGLVPSQRIAANAVGAVVTGALGAVGKTKMDDIAESAAKPAIAQAIVEYGLEDPSKTQQQVHGVQNLFGVLDEDFTGMCTDVYKTYLLGMVKYNVTPKTSELKELDSLKTALSMDNLMVGEAHAAAAAEWYRATCLFTPEEDLEDPEHPDRMAMDKFLFLTERALKQGGETEEAFVFEMTRTAKALNLDLSTSLERVASVVEPFYQRALKSTRSKLGTAQVSSAMLERARKTLGVDSVTAQDMHVACFNEEVRELLGKGDNGDGEEVSATDLKFQEGAMERLDQLRDILGLSGSDATYEIELEATPLFQATALAAMKDLLAGTKSADDAWDELNKRRQEMLLPDDSTKSLMSSMVMQSLGGPLEETNKFAKVNNEAATYDHLLEALEAKEALISILTKSGWDEFENFDATFCDPRDRYSANGFLSSMERRKLYKIFLNRSVRKSENGKLSKEMYEKVMEVKGLLGIDDKDAEAEAHSVFGPELSKVLQSAMTEILNDYTPELVKNLAKNVDEVVANFRLTEEYLQQVGAGLYSKAVETINGKAPGGIPTTEQNEALDALRGLFKLSNEDTYEPHIEYFGSVYRKSVLEAMGSTGVIMPEYRKSLDKLRGRLGVSEQSCKQIFLEAVEEKMKPMIEWIVSEMERTMLTQQQLAQRRGKDMGEDLFQTGKGADGVLGIGAEVNLMSDIMNLVDFYTENDIAEKKEVGTKTVEKKVKEGDEETTVTEEVPVYETTYPVTGLEIGSVDQEVAELLYRQFVVGGFTTQGPQGARYEGAKATFGGILGLTSEKMEDISSNIGSTVYDNFISNAMRTKGAMDQQDMMFLANIQGKLGLSSEQSEKMLLESQKKILSEEIDTIMDAPTPQSLKAFREKCNSMGMDLVEDVGISQTRLAKMFEGELVPGLKNGEITVDSVDMLTEMQESLGMSEEDCASIFESLLGRLSKTTYELIAGELLRGREEKTTDLIEELVRYANFVDGELGINVPEATGYQILNLYEALDFEGKDAETVENNKTVLKTALSLS